MEKLLEQLRERYDVLEKEREDLYKELQKVETEYRIEQLKSIDDQIPTYVSRLKRLKAYIDGFATQSYKRRVRYGFKKMGTYHDDFNDPMHDPLEWTIVEYDLLGMEWYLDIQFRYSNDIVKKFVVDWMSSNVKTALYDEDVYGFKMN